MGEETDTMLSGIHFDNIFLPVRERSKSTWSLIPELKKELEKSILRGREDDLDEEFEVRPG